MWLVCVGLIGTKAMLGKMTGGIIVSAFYAGIWFITIPLTVAVFAVYGFCKGMMALCQKKKNE